MLIQDVYALSGVLANNFNNVSGTVFNRAIIKNVKLVQEEIGVLAEILRKDNPGYIEYTQKLIQLKAKDKVISKIPNLSKVDNLEEIAPEFMVAATALQEEHKEALALFATFNAETSQLKLLPVPDDICPDNLTRREIDILGFING